ncbi:Vps36-domain-containing protein [Hesseltinella vesiculosa]|uniref:Vacuolar protein-sorting-associated protein 36 n=1 Tax=Hesseltinella vesiculosa TaxID=101127 RepID=A0A1X2G6I6_9FUNG|nr:Vps36-domain-containing protein [Hesseltinella vesiculosa]
MHFFRPTVLNTSKRPELLPNETLLIQQSNCGLYEKKNKLDGYQDGVLYLTSHRIIYVDRKNPQTHSVDLHLNSVTTMEQYNGFLRSSPKLILTVDEDIWKIAMRTTDLVALESDSLSTQATKTFQVAATVGTWACPICSHDNTLLSDKCTLCGVRTSVNQKQENEDTSGSNNNSCPSCTFTNHQSMSHCEMCDTPLTDQPVPSPSSSSGPTLATTPSPINKPPSMAIVQVAFRKSGLQLFAQHLAGVLDRKAWNLATDTSMVPLSVKQKLQQPRAVGIFGIQQKISQMQEEHNDAMTEGFKDLDQLMTKATEMVHLAERISNKLNKDPNDKDLSMLRGYMVNLGITNPVTRDMAGSIYHQELARELCEFLTKLMTNKQHDIWTLTDIYCLFNRARGVALISPQDISKASLQFDRLKLPFRVRQLESNGILTIQSVDMDERRSAARILRHTKQSGYITALQLASLENWSLVIALEQLKMIEQLGALCRDESPSGLVFYENRFCPEVA